MDAANKERLRLLQVKRLEAVLKQPENRECFDCTALQPRWASTNLGLFLCMRCAGIHRSLGTHITKVKSISMDVWDEHMIVNCETIGNGRGRAIYEACLPHGYVKPSATADTHAVERVTREKFERKAWYASAAPPVAAPVVATLVGHVHAQSQVPGHHGHAPTPVSHPNPHAIVQGAVVSPGSTVVIAASAGGATISKRPAPGAIVAGTVVSPTTTTTAAVPTPTAQPQPQAASALSFFDTIATPPGKQQQPPPPQQQPKPSGQPDWGDFFGSAATTPSTTAPSSSVVSGSHAQSPFFPTPQYHQQQPVAFDPFAACAPSVSKSAAAMPSSFSYTTHSGASPPSTMAHRSGAAATGGDPFSQLSGAAMNIAAAAPRPPHASGASSVSAGFFAAPAPAPARNAIDDLFA